MTHFNVTEEYAKIRLDAIAQKLLPLLSRSSVQKLIYNGQIIVNNHQEKTGFKVKAGDVITIQIDETDLKSIPSINLPIIYEDDDCIVIDKPFGVLSHSKGALNPEATVATFIANQLSNLSGDRAGIVHRLDRATSGVMICAKNPESLSWLQKQFAQRKTKKTYTAVIQSGIQPQEAIVDMPIERDPRNPKKFRVGKSGKSAQTHYKIIKDNGTHSLIELKPITGRTHQIRVHLKQLGYPIVGDTFYGGESANRLLLHAKSLEITLPSMKRKVFTCKTPNAFTVIMKS